MILRSTSIPNLITGLRLLSIPILWAFALQGRDAIVGLGLVFAWLTDALDGFLARRLDAQSTWGSRFDSITDGLVFASAIGWMLLLRPEFAREQAVPLLVWLAIGTAAYVVGWIRFRRIADVHLYSAKAANFLGFLFVAYLFLTESYSTTLFYLVIGVCIAAATETLYVLATFDRVDARIRSVLRRVPRRG